MKFEDIDYYECIRFGKTAIGQHLHGYWVSKSDFKLMWQYASVAMHQVDWSVPQSAETLYGKARWLDLKVGKRIALGRCLKYFAENDVLPVRVANPKKKGKRKYARK